MREWVRWLLVIVGVMLVVGFIGDVLSPYLALGLPSWLCMQ